MATYSGKIIVWLLFFCPSLYKKKKKRKKEKRKKEEGKFTFKYVKPYEINT
jgi:hypothetical protein